MANLFKRPSKQQLRDQINQGMKAFVSEGKVVTTVQPKVSAKQYKKETVVEIEVDHLPEALRKKHFGE